MRSTNRRVVNERQTLKTRESMVRFLTFMSSTYKRVVNEPQTHTRQGIQR